MPLYLIAEDLADWIVGEALSVNIGGIRSIDEENDRFLSFGLNLGTCLIGELVLTGWTDLVRSGSNSILNLLTVGSNSSATSFMYSPLKSLGILGSIFCGCVNFTFAIFLLL